jgi:uncharacterized cupredoxin-like copper-binding protein
MIVSLSSLLALLLLALAACDSGSSASESPVNEKMVTILLTEYRIAASQTTFTTGVKYHFIVTNIGQSSHELILMPQVSGVMGMGSDMSGLDKMALMHIDQSHLPPGATQSVDYTFTQPEAAGKLEFACLLGDHYQMGMHLPITVAK